jgi:microcystin degradation protein MlrC
VHFRAHFQPIAERVIVVAAPGPVVADPGALPFRNLRPGLRLRPAAGAGNSQRMRITATAEEDHRTS